jgi:hypothetical protein
MRYWLNLGAIIDKPRKAAKLSGLLETRMGKSRLEAKKLVGVIREFKVL